MKTDKVNDPKAIVVARVLEEMQRQHPAIASQAIPVKADPTRLIKGGGIDEWRIRLLPARRPRKPRRFWSTKWGFYEITYGRFPFNNANAAVWFCHYPNAEVTGHGYYREAIRRILEELHNQQPAWYYHPPFSGPFFLFGATYRVSPGKYPVKQAADDLAWLIEHSLPKFEAISSLSA